MISVKVLQDPQVHIATKASVTVSDGGYERGYAAGYEAGNTEGYTKGHADGVEQGYAEGYEEGYAGGLSEMDSLIEADTVELYNPRVTKLRSYSFHSASKLKKASFPNVTSAGAYAFGSCTSLTELHLPNLKTISQYCMRDCALLESIVLPKVTSFSTGVFRECPTLKRVDTSSVTSITSQLFYGDYALEALILRNNAVARLTQSNALTVSAFSAGTAFAYVPAALVEQYKAATNWSTYAAQIRAIEDYPEITGGES